MSQTPFVPVLPDSAPFTPEQRAYLNGFFAGLFSRVPRPGATGPAAEISLPGPLAPLAVLFGSQTGNAENLAKRIAREAGKRGFAPMIHELAKYPVAQLAAEKHALVVTSTYGDGDPPDNAKTFWEWLSAGSAPRLAETRFSVCALGDSNYPKFCAFGRAVDERLEQLGARRIHPRADCDVDYEGPFQQWLHGALASMQEASSSVNPPGNDSAPASGVTVPAAGGEENATTLEAGPPAYRRDNPFPARLLVNRRLSGPASAKDVRHFEIALQGSGLNYEVGDALGVWPRNDPALVAELLEALGARGDEPAPGRDGQSAPLRETLASHYDITRIPKPLLEAVAARTQDALLKSVTGPSANGELTKFLWGRDIIDLLRAHSSVRFAPGEFIALLRKLQPRLYSISSSPRAHPGEVHLTVSAVRYESLGRTRQGVCSTFLADRVGPETPVPVFVHENRGFRPPAPEAPLIMIGPGTGIAPFRAFLEDRRAVAAQGRNWLFFGDQRATSDYLYREELESFQKDGLLTRLDLAWSRDQSEKIYVQQRMQEAAKELFAWLEEGASLYVCGDASRMARDVDAALHQVIQTAGGRSAEESAAYVAALRKDGRYQRDVY
jgi:sulfite reductase (NADPH) flavoprotein alpha-component